MDVEHSAVGGEILKAAREAAGISLTTMAARVHFSVGQLSNVEAGRRAAKPELVAAYEREIGGPVNRRAFLTLPAIPPSLLSRMASDAERVFSTTETDASRAERVMDQVEQRGRECVVHPSTVMLRQLLADFDGLRLLIDRTRNPKIQAQLYQSAALTAALTADALMVLGDRGNAQAWHGVASVAARESGDRGAAATVAGLGSLISLYYGDLSETISRTRTCTRLTGGGIESAGVMAQTVQALALARIGDHAAAREALSRAETGLTVLGGSGNSVFEFAERRFLFYSSRTLLHLGDLQAATDAQDAALALYPSTSVGDPTLIRLDRAAVQARSGDVDGAVSNAVHVLNVVPAERRARIYLDHAASLIDAVPSEHRTRPSLRDYTDALDAMKRTIG